MRRFRNLPESRQVLFVLAVAFGLRLVWVIAAYAEPTADFLWYHLRAIGIVNGEGYGAGGSPTAFWPVGYPGFLAFLYWISGTSHAFVVFVSVVLSTVATWLTYRIAAHFAGHGVGLKAALLFAFFPPSIYLTAVLCSENLFTPLFLGGFYLFLLAATDPARPRYSLFAAAGVVLGFASLVRAQAVLLPVVLAIWMLRRYRLVTIFVAGVVTCLTMLAVVLPWTARNYEQFHRFILVSDNGPWVFYFGNNREADGGAIYPRDFWEPYKDIDRAEWNPEPLSWSLGWNEIRRDPSRMPGLVLKKWNKLFLSGRVGAGWELGPNGRPSSRAVRNVFRNIGQLYQLTLLAMAALYLLISRIGSASPPVMPIVAVLIFWAVFHAIFFGQGRFLQPIVPLIAALSALFWQRVSDFAAARASAPR